MKTIIDQSDCTLIMTCHRSKMDACLPSRGPRQTSGDRTLPKGPMTLGYADVISARLVPRPPGGRAIRRCGWHQRKGTRSALQSDRRSKGRTGHRRRIGGRRTEFTCNACLNCSTIAPHYRRVFFRNVRRGKSRSTIRAIRALVMPTAVYSSSPRITVAPCPIIAASSSSAIRSIS
jgi:hypothetical protein